MLRVNGLIGFGARRVATSSAVTRSFRAAYTSTADGTSYTFNSADIGTASADRIVVVCAMGRANVGGTGITALTINGISATQRANANNAPQLCTAEIYTLSVASGSTADIVVSTGNHFRLAIAVYALYGASSEVPSDTVTGFSDPYGGTIDVAANGVVIGCASFNGTSSTSTAVGVTEDFDQAIETTSTHTSGSEEFASAQTGLTVQFDASSTTGGGAAFAAWP